MARLPDLAFYKQISFFKNFIQIIHLGMKSNRWINLIPNTDFNATHRICGIGQPDDVLPTGIINDVCCSDFRILKLCADQ